MKRSILLYAVALASGSAFADNGGMMANPQSSSRPGVASGPVSRSANLTVRLHNSCYATNNRSVANPLSPSSIITAVVPVTTNTSGTVQTNYFAVSYAGDAVTAKGVTTDSEMSPNSYGVISDPKILSSLGTTNGNVFGGFHGGSGQTAQVKGPPISTFKGMTASSGGNIVQFSIPGLVQTVSGSGAVAAGTNISVGRMQFWEQVTDCSGPPVYGSIGVSSHVPAYPCGSFMGKTGWLTAAVNAINVSSDQSTVDIDVSFPGQTGFCGGYYSPLMLFFDDKRPDFNGKSAFKLSQAGDTYWVESNHPGYFLAIDRNGNGTIDGVEELFGSQDSNKSGFESLKELDSNGDGVIDAKDEMFDKLLLWNDKNGDGISQPEELTPLSKLGVVKISLKYKNVIHAYGQTAQSRQIGEFWYKGKKGKLKKGVIEDIWFSPAR